MTFVDALVLVRLYRAHQRVDGPFLESIVTWLTSEVLTNGAREVLENLLRSEGRKLSHERARGQRRLTIADHARSVRLGVQEPLLVDLERRESLGLEWHLKSEPPSIEVGVTKNPSRPGKVTFTVQFSRPGTYQLRFEECILETWVRPSAKGRMEQPRALDLTVTADEFE